jgi:LysR family transcriptional regulator, hca operon transcriptional activator
LEIRHLRAFVAVTDAQSVRKGAERLHVAQSALGRTIRDLERELGVPLFARSPHGARLTESGERFMDGARRTLVEANAAIARARDARASGSGPLVIGVVNPELRPSWIQTVLRQFRDEMPALAIHLEPMASIAMAEAATQRAIDVGIGYTIAPSHGITVRTVTDDVMAGVIVARTHALARRRCVSIFDLEPYPFLWYDRPVHPTLFDRIFAAFQRVGFTARLIPGIGQVDANAAAAFALVSSSSGWALYPTTARPALPSTMRYVPLRDVSIPLETDLLVRADDRSERTRVFSRIVGEIDKYGD